VKKNKRFDQKDQILKNAAKEAAKELLSRSSTNGPSSYLGF
jgi:hypothetical protein